MSTAVNSHTERLLKLAEVTRRPREVMNLDLATSAFTAALAAGTMPRPKSDG